MQGEVCKESDLIIYRRGSAAVPWILVFGNIGTQRRSPTRPITISNPRTVWRPSAEP